MTFSGRSATQWTGAIQQERTSAAVPVTEAVLGHSECRTLYRELTAAPRQCQIYNFYAKKAISTQILSKTDAPLQFCKDLKHVPT